MLSYGLDRLVDNDTFLKIYLGLHALSSQAGLTVQFIDLHEVEGRARWLLGIVEFLEIDMNGDSYDVQDFDAAFERLRKEREQQEEEKRELEVQRRLAEEKDKWDEDHQDMVLGMLRDTSKDNRRSAFIEEERDRWDADHQDMIEGMLQDTSKDNRRPLINF